MKAIVAVDSNWAIGYRGRLLFCISDDLKRFRSITLGHPVILGRKTLETFPGGRPLPGRPNLILSRTPGFLVEGAVVYPSLEALLPAAPEDSLVIGGERVYEALLPRCSTVYVTKIQASAPAADAWFPNLDLSPHWTVTQEEALREENGLSFRYLTYERISPDPA